MEFSSFLYSLGGISGVETRVKSKADNQLLQFRQKMDYFFSWVEIFDQDTKSHKNWFSVDWGPVKMEITIQNGPFFCFIVE